ncbi:MAG TPA: hypothetical protein VHC95_03790 [Opitutales bacterium]|nr:hypothetical protein [Opitutales bacterium]
MPHPPSTGPAQTRTVTSAWREAEAAGVDMSLLEHSLRLTMWERLVEHQAALDLVEALQSGKIEPPCRTY